MTNYCEQRTVKGTAASAGVGLHTGAATAMAVTPAAPSTGIVFVRTDLEREGFADAAIPAWPGRVTATRLGVRLANEAGASVMTIEHVMAALALCGVDNARIEIDGPEPPAFDGSAYPVMRLIEEAGLQPQSAPRLGWRLTAPVRVEDGDRYIEASPHEFMELDVSIDFSDPAIGRQRERLVIGLGDTALRRIAMARTFCTLKDVEGMQAGGFSRGGSLDNALVVDGGRVLNDEGLRDPNEFVLHKLLDLLGDLNLLGGPLLGRIRAHKPGHDLNTRLARLVAENAGIAERTQIAVAH